MKPHYTKMWTTDRENYCLIEVSDQLGYSIFRKDTVSLLTIEDDLVAEQVVQNMLGAGVRIITKHEWNDFILSYFDNIADLYGSNQNDE